MYRRKTLHFVKRDSTVPFIKLMLGDDSQVLAIVDTGSEETLFDKAFVKKHKDQFNVQPKMEKIQAIGVGGKPFVQLVLADVDVSFVHGRIKKKVHLHGRIMDLSFIDEHLAARDDINLPVAMLIGSDMLSELGAVINMDNYTMEL